MTTLTVHDLPEAQTEALRARAARNGRSLEAEVRAILREALRVEPRSEEQGGLGTEIHELFATIGGVDIPEHPPVSPRELPRFD